MLRHERMLRTSLSPTSCAGGGLAVFAALLTAVAPSAAARAETVTLVAERDNTLF
jgi:hypothetical protein